MEPYGLRLLPTPKATKDLGSTYRHPVLHSLDAYTRSIALPATFDVAISFVGSERTYAEALANAVREAGFAVFYDDFYPAQLWGKNLYGSSPRSTANGHGIA